MGKPWVVAFYGPGSVTYEMVAEILDDWLPEEDMKVFLPSKIGRSDTGLKQVKKWLEDVDQPYTSVETDDIIPDLLAERDTSEVYLVLLWGEEGNPRSEALLADATAQGIPVKDLTRALDDLELTEDEPEPEPEPEEKPKPRRRKKATTEDEKEDTEAIVAAAKAEAAEVAAKMQAAKDRRAEEKPDEAQALVDVDRLVEAALVEAAVEGQRRILGENLIAAFTEFVLALVKEDTVPSAPPGRPRKDGKPAGSVEETVTLIDHGEGEYSIAGRGRPRRGEKRVTVTVSEAKELGVEV